MACWPPTVRASCVSRVRFQLSPALCAHGIDRGVRSGGRGPRDKDIRAWEFALGSRPHTLCNPNTGCQQMALIKSQIQSRHMFTHWSTTVTKPCIRDWLLSAYEVTVVLTLPLCQSAARPVGQGCQCQLLRGRGRSLQHTRSSTPVPTHPFQHTCSNTNVQVLAPALSPKRAAGRKHGATRSRLPK